MPRQYDTKAIKLATRHYLRQIRRDWRVAAPALLLPGIGSILVFYAPPLIVGKILSRFEQQGGSSLNELLPYILLVGGVWFAGEIIWRIAIHFFIRTEQRGVKALYAKALEYLLEKDLAFFHNNFAGSLTKKTVAYAKHYEGFFDTLGFNIASNILTLIFVIFVLWRFSPLFVFALVGIMTLTLLLLLPLIRRRQKLVIVREEASNVVAGRVADTIANMEAVRAFARERYEAEAHTQNVSTYMAKALRSWDYQNKRIDLVASPLYVLTNIAGLALAIFIGRNLETVFITFSYYANYTRVMWEFNRIYRNIENHLSEAAQFTQLLLEPPRVADPPHPELFAFRRGDIEFRDVRFRHRDSAGEHLFDHFNLSVASGEKIGLVGRSGGGKTTVTRLLLRFMDVDSGNILIDGQNIAKVRQNDFRAHIAYVPQDSLMFHRSVRENIRYGRLDASDEEIEEAARMAHAEEFIEKLPEGYDTLIGERGMKLSGGQRQRIAIARAMVRNAPILVLDEATSALDSESEKLIQDALWKLMAGRTSIVIAHRLSTVQRLDRIVVLEEGAIVEQGKHAELLRKGGLYANLWRHQTGGFLAGEEEEKPEPPSPIELSDAFESAEEPDEPSGRPDIFGK